MSHPGFVAACLLALWGTAALSRQVPAFAPAAAARPALDQATVVRRNPGASGTIDPDVHQPAVAVGARVCATCHAAWFTSVDERPSQQDAPAGDGGQRSRGFLEKTSHAEGHRYRLRDRQRRILHHRVVPHRQSSEHRSNTPWQPPHPALPDDHRERLGWSSCRRAGTCAAQWFDNMEIVRPDERRACPAVEQELRRLPRQPAENNYTAGDPHLRDRSGPISARRANAATVPAARTSPLTPAQPSAAIDDPLIVRPTPRSSEQHDLRAVPLVA